MRFRHSSKGGFIVASDGINLVDDMGGVRGIGYFLNSINETGGDVGQYEDGKKDSLRWARSLGWSRRKIAKK